MVQSEHRRVQNDEDFTRWDWGDRPDRSGRPLRDIVAEIKEWSAAFTYEKSCAAGAAIAFEELAREGFFVLRGTTDKGLLVEFMGTDQFVICDELDIVEEAIRFDDPQRISSHLRRLADAIDAASIATAPAVPT